MIIFCERKNTLNVQIEASVALYIIGHLQRIEPKQLCNHGLVV